VTEQALNSKAKMEVSVQYLQSQLAQFITERQKGLRDSSTPSKPSDPDENNLDYSLFVCQSRASKSSRGIGDPMEEDTITSSGRSLV